MSFGHSQRPILYKDPYTMSLSLSLSQNILPFTSSLLSAVHHIYPESPYHAQNTNPNTYFLSLSIHFCVSIKHCTVRRMALSPNWPDELKQKCNSDVHYSLFHRYFSSSGTLQFLFLIQSLIDDHRQFQNPIGCHGIRSQNVQSTAQFTTSTANENTR